MQIKEKVIYRDISDQTLASFTSDEHAEWMRKRGKSIIKNRNVYWHEIKKGFFQPSHIMAKCSPEQISIPTIKTWGIRASLESDVVHKANSYYEMHVIPNLKDYNFELLSANRRNQYRRSLKRCRIVEVLNKSILLEQGYPVITSSLERIGRIHNKPDEKTYYSKCGAFINDGNNKHMVLAGLVDGKLGGIIEVFAVDGFAYLETANFADFALPSYISMGLHYEFIQLCKRSSAVHTLVHGQVAREDEGLRVFKQSLNFVEMKVPSMVKLFPGLGVGLKMVAPDKYNKLFYSVKENQN